MPKRLIPSEQMARKIEDLLSGEIRTVSELIIQTSRWVIQRALEREAQAYTGRSWCERQGGEPIYRNGYEPKRVSTAEGELEVEVPQFRNGEQGFASKLLAVLPHRSDSLELLSVQMWVMGCSQADIAEVFRGDLGLDNMSEAVVRGLCQDLKERYEGFCKQDLSSQEIWYLFLDGIYLPLRKKAKTKEAVLAAIGFNQYGKKVLLGLALGPRESYTAWHGFLRDLRERGLNDPLLVIRDSNPGLIKALREDFPHTAHQVCLAHKTMNLVEKMPGHLEGELRLKLDNALYAKDYATALKLSQEMIQEYRGQAEAFVQCLEKDLEETLAYFKFPQNHWKAIRTTNVIERRFEEVRRRTKVIPRFQSETSCLMLCLAVLTEYAKKKPWRGLKTTDQDKERLQELRLRLLVERKELKMVA